MLDSIEFSGYKLLDRISLQRLTFVNYFVGENNSGKSRILEYISVTYSPLAVMVDDYQKSCMFELHDYSCFYYEGLKYLVIDEPENHLHPSLQKKIPQELKFISEHFKLQIFVATHSPFIISSSSAITYAEREELMVDKSEFLPSQKIYFVKDGAISNRYGEIGIDNSGYSRGSFGYWGFKASSIAMKMLGAGLMDLLPHQKSTPTSNSPILVLCEGEGKDEDAAVYNIIFKTFAVPVMFVSARGSSQLSRTFEIVQEIRASLSANFRLVMLRDRDHEFPTELDIEFYESTNPGSRVLRKRALECYLYNSETLGLLLKQVGIELSRKDRRRMNTLQRKIQQEAEDGVVGSSYKSRLRDLFKLILKEYGYFKLERFKPKQMRLLLASLVTGGTKTYRELKKTVFDEKGSYIQGSSDYVYDGSF